VEGVHYDSPEDLKTSAISDFERKLKEFADHFVDIYSSKHVTP